MSENFSAGPDLLKIETDLQCTEVAAPSLSPDVALVLHVDHLEAVVEPAHPVPREETENIFLL
jgi:hypothetical protein